MLYAAGNLTTQGHSYGVSSDWYFAYSCVYWMLVLSLCTVYVFSGSLEYMQTFWNFKIFHRRFRIKLPGAGNMTAYTSSSRKRQEALAGTRANSHVSSRCPCLLWYSDTTYIHGFSKNLKHLTVPVMCKVARGFSKSVARARRIPKKGTEKFVRAYIHQCQTRKHNKESTNGAK